MPGDFYTMPGEFYEMPGKSLNQRFALIQGLLGQSERGFIDGVDILGTQRLDFRKKKFSTEQSL